MKYIFENTYWVDGHEDCSCCSGLRFDIYELVSTEGYSGFVEVVEGGGYSTNDEEGVYGIALQHYNYIPANFSPYENISLQEIKRACKDVGIEIIIERGKD